MNGIARNRGLAVLLAAALSSALAVGFLLFTSSRTPSIPQPSKEAVARMKLQDALRDATLLDLIHNARVAARKGDSVTHRAMVSGLKRESPRARTLIHGEISKSSDSNDISILNRIISELP